MLLAADVLRLEPFSFRISYQWSLRDRRIFLRDMPNRRTFCLPNRRIFCRAMPIRRIFLPSETDPASVRQWVQLS